MVTHPARDVVVVGASAGGIEALRQLLSGLPPDLPAAVLVVVHVPKTGGSALPGVLARSGPLPAAAATDGERLEPGRVYVAPPDRHLLVVGEEIRVSAGPRQNGHRPAADALFFSAALSAGPGVLAIVLSGALDDGALGAAAVEERGGIVAAQDPDEAAYPSMPRSALLATRSAVALPVRDLSDLVARRSGEAVETEAPEPSPDLTRTVEALLGAVPGAEGLPGEPVGFSCPTCGGPLFGLQEGKNDKFSCLVGHTWSARTLFDQQAHVLENALWVAVRALDERTRLAGRIVTSAAERGHNRTVDRFEEVAEESSEALRALRRLLEGRSMSERTLPVKEYPPRQGVAE